MGSVIISPVPRRAGWDVLAVEGIAREQHGFITAAQLRGLDVPSSTVCYRNGELGGMFTWVLPGVHLLGARRELTEDERECAALLYAGPGSMLTGRSALRHYGVRAAETTAIRPVDRVHVLVAHARQRASHGFVRVERTVFLPPSPRARDGVLCAPVPRCAIDAVRGSSSLPAVTAVLAEVVQRRMTTVDALTHELSACQRRGSRYPRMALEEVRGGIRSVPEGDFKAAVDQVPELRGVLYNPSLSLPDGQFLASPDAYDMDTGTAVETDSQAHHLAAADWRETMARHARMTAQGLAVLHFPPSLLRHSMSSCVRDFRSTVAARRGIALPALIVIDCHGDRVA